MRAFSLFTFAIAVLGGVSALTLPVKRSELDSLAVLEVREPKNAVPNAIKFSAGAKAHLDKLGLAKGSAERKAVKEYHRKIVAAQMATNGATTAQIKHLGHSTGSVDNKYHVTAAFWDKGDNRMKSTYGAPGNTKQGDLFHVHADPAHADPHYVAAVHKAGKTL